MKTFTADQIAGKLFSFSVPLNLKNFVLAFSEWDDISEYGGYATMIWNSVWRTVGETYTIAGEAGSGMICLNGAAARQVAVGDHVILMCYAQMTPEEAKEHHPKVVFVDADNHIARVTNYEKHGKLTDDFIGA